MKFVYYLFGSDNRQNAIYFRQAHFQTRCWNARISIQHKSSIL